MDEKAVDAVEKFLALVGQLQVAAELKKAFATGGMKAFYRKQIELASNPASPGYGPGRVAQSYAALGDKDNAFLWLNKSYAAREIMLMYLKVDATYAPLRSDPRFADLVKRIGLPQ